MATLLATALLIHGAIVAAISASTNRTACPCFHCGTVTPCAGPACQHCGLKSGSCGTGGGCYTTAAAACSCSPATWPTGKGCTEKKAEYVYWADDESKDYCCQMPKQWMKQPHDNDGTRVPALPYPFSTALSGAYSACGSDGIPRTARFTHGTCKGAGFPDQRGGCNHYPNCWCSTSWSKAHATLV